WTLSPLATLSPKRSARINARLSRPRPSREKRDQSEAVLGFWCQSMFHIFTFKGKFVVCLQRQPSHRGEPVRTGQVLQAAKKWSDRRVQRDPTYQVCLTHPRAPDCRVAAGYRRSSCTEPRLPCQQLPLRDSRFLSRTNRDRTC